MEFIFRKGSNGNKNTDISNIVHTLSNNIHQVHPQSKDLSLYIKINNAPFCLAMASFETDPGLLLLYSYIKYEFFVGFFFALKDFSFDKKIPC